MKTSREKKMLSSSSYIKLPGIKIINILKTYRHSISKRVKVTFVYKYLNSQYNKKNHKGIQNYEH